MYRVIKRDGKIVDFDIARISAAIVKAFDATDSQYNTCLLYTSRCV